MVLYVVIVVAVLAVLIVPSLVDKTPTNTYTYNHFLTAVKDGDVKTASVDNSTGVITGYAHRRGQVHGQRALSAPDSEIAALQPLGFNAKFVTPTSNALVSILTWILPFALIGIVFFYISRKAQGQMGSIMSIGRSKAKLY